MSRPHPEPWRVKVVEPIGRIGPAEREECLHRAGYTMFGIASEDINNDHLEYVAEVTVRLHRNPGTLRGLRIVHQAPVLRHFTARFEPVESAGE